MPYVSLSKVDELNLLKLKGVNTPDSYSTWTAPIVVMKKKNGTTRLCADFSTSLNAAFEQHHHALPIPADLFTMLNNGILFAKLDLADANLQVEAAEESRELLTINIHCGLVLYNRLPFGFKIATPIFQQLTNTILSGITCVTNYLDYTLVVATS